MTNSIEKFLYKYSIEHTNKVTEKYMHGLPIHAVNILFLKIKQNINNNTFVNIFQFFTEVLLLCALVLLRNEVWSTGM